MSLRARALPLERMVGERFMDRPTILWSLARVICPLDHVQEI